MAVRGRRTAGSAMGGGVLGREQIRRGRWRWQREVAGDGAGEGDDGADEGGDVHVGRGEFMPLIQNERRGRGDRGEGSGVERVGRRWGLGFHRVGG